LREQAVSAPAASAAATLGLAHCLIRDARANRASAILTRLLPSLQGSERLHALLLDAQAQTVLARYDTAIARAREVGVAAAAMDAKALRARALTVEAEAGLLAGKQAEAARANDEAAALLRTLGDPGGAAIAEQKGTMLTLVVQDPARAEALLREHLTLAGELGEPVLAAQSRRLISAAQKAQGRLAESRTMLEQALAGYVALGDRQWQAKIDVNLAMRDQLEGDFSGAEARVRDALDAFPAQGYERAFVQAEKAYILRSQGRFEDALRAIEVAFETAATMRSESRILQVRCERSAILWSHRRGTGRPAVLCPVRPDRGRAGTRGALGHLRPDPACRDRCGLRQGGGRARSVGNGGRRHRRDRQSGHARRDADRSHPGRDRAGGRDAATAGAASAGVGGDGRAGPAHQDGRCPAPTDARRCRLGRCAGRDRGSDPSLGLEHAVVVAGAAGRARPGALARRRRRNAARRGDAPRGRADDRPARCLRPRRIRAAVMTQPARRVIGGSRAGRGGGPRVRRADRRLRDASPRIGAQRVVRPQPEIPQWFAPQRAR